MPWGIGPLYITILEQGGMEDYMPRFFPILYKLVNSRKRKSESLYQTWLTMIPLLNLSKRWKWCLERNGKSSFLTNVRLVIFR